MVTLYIRKRPTAYSDSPHTVTRTVTRDAAPELAALYRRAGHRVFYSA